MSAAARAQPETGPAGQRPRGDRADPDQAGHGRPHHPPIPPQDDDADLIAEAEAALDRIERGEEKVWTFDEWKRRGDALDR